MRNLLIGLFLLSIGCQDLNFPKRPDQDIAEYIVWKMMYGQTDKFPPTEWKTDNLDCGDGTAWIESGLCLDGVTRYFPQTYIVIAMPDPTAKFSNSAFVHEPMHVMFHNLYGDGDNEHRRPEWGFDQFSVPWDKRKPGLLDVAREELIKNNL